MSVDALEGALRSTAIQPESIVVTGEGPQQNVAPSSASDPARPGSSGTSNIGSDSQITGFRPNSVINVHRKTIVQDVSDTDSDQEYNDPYDNIPSHQPAHSAVIGDYVNVGTFIRHVFTSNFSELTSETAGQNWHNFSDLS